MKLPSGASKAMTEGMQNWLAMTMPNMITVRGCIIFGVLITCLMGYLEQGNERAILFKQLNENENPSNKFLVLNDPKTAKLTKCQESERKKINKLKRREF